MRSLHLHANVSAKHVQELGIPTANISAEAVGECLAEAVTGIYYGWASVGSAAAVHMMVMSVGYNPFYGNTAKTCEPWLLSEFAQVRAQRCTSHVLHPSCSFVYGHVCCYLCEFMTQRMINIFHFILQDFYGEELRLLVLGYVRPEADFTTLEDLKQRIHHDADVTRSALLDPALAAYQHDSFLQPAALDA